MDVLFWNAIWVTAEDAFALHQDTLLHGDCYVKITNAGDKDAGGWPEGERVPPVAVRLA